MKAMKCDRCKNYYDADTLEGSEKALWFEHIILTNYNEKTNIDLCPYCRKSFNLWLKGGAENG